MKKHLFPLEKKTDCTENDLPHTRPQLFWDVVRNRYDVLFKIGSLFLLFALPYMAVSALANIYGNSLLDQLNSGTLSFADYQGSFLTLVTIKRLGQSLALLLFSFPLASTLRIVKRLAFMENIQFGREWKAGFHEDFKECVLVMLILSISFFIVAFSWEYGSLYYGSDYLFSLVFYAPSFFLVLFFLPLSLFVFAQIPVYSNKLTQSFRNAFGFYAKSVFPSLGFSLLFSSLLLVEVIPNVYVTAAFVLFYFLILIPLTILAFFLFACHLFDRYLNSKVYPELVDKGLFRTKK